MGVCGRIASAVIGVDELLDELLGELIDELPFLKEPDGSLSNCCRFTVSPSDIPKRNLCAESSLARCVSVRPADAPDTGIVLIGATEPPEEFLLPSEESLALNEELLLPSEESLALNEELLLPSEESLALNDEFECAIYLYNYITFVRRLKKKYSQKYTHTVFRL